MVRPNADKLNALLTAYVIKYDNDNDGEGAAELAKEHKLLMTAAEAQEFAQAIERDGYLDHIQMWRTAIAADGTIIERVQLPSGTHFKANAKAKPFLATGGYYPLRDFHSATSIPKKNPDTSTTVGSNRVGQLFQWFKRNKILSALIGLAIAVGTMWLDKNWDGHFTNQSFRALFGIDP